MSQTDTMAGLLADEMEKMKDSDNEFLQTQKSMRGNLDNLYKEMFAQLSERSKPNELPDEIQQIASILQAQPRLIPAVQSFLQTKVAELNAAIDQVLGPVNTESESK